MKLLMAMLVVLCACGASDSGKAPRGSGGKRGGAVAKVADDAADDADDADDAGDSGDEGDEDGAEDSADGGAKGKKGGQKGGTKGDKKGSPKSAWGSGKARACLDESKLRDGAPSFLAGAFEKELLRVCREMEDGGEGLRACVGLDPQTGRASRASDKPLAPAGAIPSGTLKTEGKKPEACSSEGKCRALGKKAAKAVQAALATEGGSATVTADAALVAVSGEAREVWNVAKDRPVKLPPPRAIDAERAKSPVFQAVGRHLAVKWGPCDEPCSVVRVLDAKGKTVVDDVASEDVPHFLDAARWTLLAGDLHVFELATGKRLRTIPLFAPGDPTYEIEGVTYKLGGKAIHPSPSIPLGDGRVAILLQHEPVVVIANLDEGKVEARHRLPLCDDVDAQQDAEELAADPAKGGKRSKDGKGAKGGKEEDEEAGDE